MSERYLQLSDKIATGRFSDVPVEEAIERNAHYVKAMIEKGTLKLAPGALRYLREQIREQDIWQGNYDVETYKNG